MYPISYNAKPIELKILEGNPGHQKHAKPLPVTRTSQDPPAWLDDVARGEWARVVRELSAMGCYADIDQTALAAYCDTYARWRKASSMAELEVDETDSGYRQQNPMIAVARSYLKEMRSLMSEFGMTPASRAKIAMKQNQDAGEWSEFLDN